MTDSPNSSRLGQLAAIARALGAPILAEDATALSERATRGEFYVACIGQMKRGKSTLIDALLGAPILPRGVTPVTAVPTIVRYGNAMAARVRCVDQDGSPQPWRIVDPAALAEWVSEEENPGNARQVLAVEVRFPSPLLQSGLTLVDTPGVGSIFAANTAATREFVPQVDAAVLVIGADPPLTADELSLAATIGQSTTHVVAVLNKADRVRPGEAREAADFAHRALTERLGRAIAPVLVVSAAAQLSGDGDPREWPALVETLQRLAREAGAALVTDAIARGTQRIARRLAAIVDERRRALTDPLEVTAARATRLAEIGRHAADAMNDVRPLMRVEAERVGARLAVERRAYLERQIPASLARFAALSAAVPRQSGPRLRRALNRLAQDEAQKALMPWLESQTVMAEAAFNQAMERFTRELARILDDVSAPGGAGLAADTELPQRAIGARSEFYFKSLMNLAAPASPLRWIADVALGAIGARVVIERDARRFLVWLLEMNSSRVESDVRQRVEDGRAALERRVRRGLEEAALRATDAAAEAARLRTEGVHAVEAELARLDRLTASLARAVAPEPMR